MLRFWRSFSNFGKLIDTSSYDVCAPIQTSSSWKSWISVDQPTYQRGGMGYITLHIQMSIYNKWDRP